MPGRLLGFISLTLIALCLARAADSRAQAPRAPLNGKATDADGGDPKLRIEEASNQQDRLRRQFEEFKQALLRLKQRLEVSPKPEDREKALVLTQAIAKASEQGTDAKFTALIAALKGSDSFKDLDALQLILDKNQDLRKDIRALIELLLKDDRDAQLKREREDYARMLEKLKEVILKQEKARSQAEAARKSAEDLEKLQKKVTDETRDLIARTDDRNKKSGDGKNAKAKG
ncbi:MAG: hypothetical protein ACRD36_07415, partial [Candidatus Acidiferrum sp.]